MLYKKNNLLFVGIVALGSFLRLLFLGNNDIWFDEGFLLFATKLYEFPPLPQSISPVNPPLYYILMKIWASCFGISEFALRLPSALLNISSFFIIYLLAKRIFCKNIALLSLLILALNPFHLWYSQEAANYSLAVFLGLLSSYYCYSYFFHSKEKKYLFFYIAAATLSLYSNYFCAVLIVCLQIYVFLFSRERLKEKLYASLPFLAVLPIIPFILTKISLLSGYFWIPRPTLQSIMITFENFFFGYNGTSLLYRAADILALFLLFKVCQQIFQKSNEKNQIYFCLTLFILPILLCFIFSKLFFSIYLDRGLLIFSPFFYILLSWAILKIKWRILKQLTITMLCILLAAGNLRYFSNQMHMPYNHRHHVGVHLKKPFKPIAKFINSNLDENIDYAFISYAAPSFSLIYYLKLRFSETRAYAFYVYDQNLNDTNIMRPFKELYKGCESFLTIENALDIIKKRSGKVFLVGGTFQRDGELDENSQKVKEAFDKALIFLNALDFDGLKLFIYKIPEK